MFAYCLNDPVNHVDNEGTTALWYYMREVHDWGFIHRCVEAHIALTNLGIQTELVLNTGSRADLVEIATGEVWEIKHASTAPMFRMWDAVEQATSYLNSKGVGEKSHIKTEKLGRAGRFTGSFEICCLETEYRVEYWTPINGVVLYSVEELGAKQPNYAYAYEFAYEKKKQAMLNKSVISLPSIDWNFHIFASTMGAGMACAIVFGVQRLYTNQNYAW